MITIHLKQCTFSSYVDHSLGYSRHLKEEMDWGHRFLSLILLQLLPQAKERNKVQEVKIPL